MKHPCRMAAPKGLSPVRRCGKGVVSRETPLRSLFHVKHFAMAAREGGGNEAGTWGCFADPPPQLAALENSRPMR